MLLIMLDDIIFHRDLDDQMLAAVFELARPLLYALDPEQAHELTLKSLEAGIYPRPASGGRCASLGMSVWGLDFPNPLGHRRGLRQGCARAGRRSLAWASVTRKSAR